MARVTRYDFAALFLVGLTVASHSAMSARLARVQQVCAATAVAPTPMPTADATQRVRAWRAHNATLEASGGGVVCLDCSESGPAAP